MDEMAYNNVGYSVKPDSGKACERFLEKYGNANTASSNDDFIVQTTQNETPQIKVYPYEEIF